MGGIMEGNKVIKYRDNYIRAANSFVLIALFNVVRMFFFIFKNEKMVYLLETMRLVNIAGNSIGGALEYIFIVGMSLAVSAVTILCWWEARRGNLWFYLGYVIFFFADMFLYFYSYDKVSFFLHFAFLAYMVYGLIYYKKMYLEHLKSKGESK